MSNKLESLQKQAITWIQSEDDISYSTELYTNQKIRQVDTATFLKVFSQKFFYNLMHASLQEYFSTYQGGSRLPFYYLESYSIV